MAELRTLARSPDGLFPRDSVLFGLSDADEAIAEGGPVVLVEGPIDAVAVTQASAGTMAGVAALGAALTDHHATALCDQLGAGSQQLVVALDADDAGHHAARNVHARVGAVNLDPRGVVLPPGLDPADVAQHYGAAALFDQLGSTRSLTAQVIDHALQGRELETPEGRVLAARAASGVIVAAPPATWQREIATTAERHGLDVVLVQAAVVDRVEGDDSDKPRRAGSNARFARTASPVELARMSGSLITERVQPPGTSAALSPSVTQVQNPSVGRVVRR